MTNVMAARLIFRSETVSIDRTGLTEFDHRRIDLAGMLSRAFDTSRHPRQGLESLGRNRLITDSAQFVKFLLFLVHCYHTFDDT